MAEQHEKALVPQIRFTGFTDPWEQRKLGEVARRVTRKNENGDSDLPLTISAQYGLVDQRTFFNSQVASKDMSGYFLLHRGEFAYNKSTSTDSPWGAIKRLEKYDMGCVSTLYICFELLSGDPDFLVTYYETDRWYKSVQLIAAEGARNHGLLNIAPDDFFETQICIPKRIDEQRRIGAFFDRLDSLITLHQRKYDKLCVLKKSMLDKMFPKGGSLYPEIRFAGFTDPWEQRKLGQHLKLSRELGHTGVDARKLTVKLWGKGVVEKTDLYGGSAQTQYYIRHAGQFMYGKLDFLHAAFGVVPDKLDCFESTLDSPAFDIEGLDSSFLLNLVTQEDFYLKNGNIANGSRKAKRIHEETFLNMEIRAPELVEQRRIGAFLDRLDSLITLHQRKLELLRNIKKSMLDKMFV
ncbi:restriction endonuclease subunit S [Bifidobacterium adolescentis]|nr:restriction endonuclease subunit S [Bifidobacterium adolescentis]KAB5849026.1 restriction endonuclease subunit S [Bifidobacterium adolescentis]KAB5851449.1 restriction endonuclease subunit S [Bifidobacterium adolescentis]KAB5852672.1 restriction endonuclease subunit S [Bifidobacterium adolescentis]KAB5863793.1 restriction endonuclease subunit S [Bifidobacterium adolescentis]